MALRDGAVEGHFPGRLRSTLGGRKTVLVRTWFQAELETALDKLATVSSALEDDLESAAMRKSGRGERGDGVWRAVPAGEAHHPRGDTRDGIRLRLIRQARLTGGELENLALLCPRV